MTTVSVPKDVWTTIVTASADTIIENLGHSEVFITTEAPTLTPFTNKKLTITTIEAGQTARVFSVGKPTEVRHYEGVLTAKTFGAKGDGVTNDTSSLQAAFTYVAANGGVLVIPAGHYLTTSRLSITSAIKPFKIIGAGRNNTIIERSIDFGASVIQIDNSDDWQFTDLTIDAKHSVRPNGNHGFVFYDCSNVDVKNVFVKDYKNSGIIGYTDPPSTNYKNVIVEQCEVDGLNSANNGILLVDYIESGIVNCRAINIGKTGSPCYGLQLKNGCQDSYILGGYTNGAKIGVACGNSDLSGTNTKNIIQGVKVFDCNVGLAFGNAIGNLAEGIIIDMNNSGNSAVDMNEDSVGNVARDVTVFNLAAGKAAALFRDADTDNVVHIASISNSGGLRPAMETISGALRNHVTLDHYVNPTVTPNSNLITNSGGPTNTFHHTKMERRQLSTVSSGVISISDNLVKHIQVDTEGGAATDDLDTITPGQDLQTIILGTANNSRDVTIKHSTGNIRLAGGADFTLNTTSDTITLVYRGALAVWCEISRSDNS
jgi:hypothetical protein